MVCAVIRSVTRISDRFFVCSLIFCSPVCLQVNEAAHVNMILTNDDVDNDDDVDD